MAAVALSLVAAYAQKSDADIQKAIDKAVAASQDAKKAAKPATWMNLGKAYMADYSNPTANLAQGIDRATFSMMFKQTPVSEEAVTVNGQDFTKVSYPSVDVFFGSNGLLTFWIPTHFVNEDPLALAAAAYQKAYEVGAKDKDVAPKLKEIVDAYTNDAYNAYAVGDMEKAFRNFKGSADVSLIAPNEEPDKEAFYNAAYTAFSSGHVEVADEYYNKCIELDHLMDGNVYAALSEVKLAQKDTIAAKNTLAAGLTKFPDNASILANLINLYLQTNEDPAKIVELLGEAKKAMPDNASLYYVEGQIYVGISKFDEAVNAYNQALVIQPGYDMAYYGLGNVDLKKGEAIVDQMNALDVRQWKEYDALKEQLTKVYVDAIGHFEKCYENASNDQVKAASADFLKRLNFQLRGEGSQYEEAYKKWEEILATLQ